MRSWRYHEIARLLEQEAKVAGEKKDTDALKCAARILRGRADAAAEEEAKARLARLEARKGAG